MRNSSRRDLPLLTAAVLLGCAAPAGAQQAPAPTPSPATVTAVGTAQLTPEPEDRNDNASIRRAVEAARTEAVPLALKAARSRAVDLAFASGLNVGQALTVAETPSPFFGPYPQDQGTFGPGRFCGNVPRYRIQRNAAGRIVKRTRIGTRRLCRVPRVVVSVTVTYAAVQRPSATPAPAPAA